MSAPWMPLYVADYIKDTGHLSAAEHGAYLLLIMHYWSTGGLPIEDKRLASIARMSLDEWQGSRSTIYAFFEDSWTHPRIERHLAEAEESYSRRAEAGRKGGNAKAKLKQSHGDDKPKHKAPLKQSEPQPSSHPGDEARDARDRRLEGRCREIAVGLPVLVDTNFVDLLDLLDREQNLTHADVLTGLEAVVKTRHRLEFWGKLDRWVRRAARDRLAAAMREPANYARAGPEGRAKSPPSNSESRTNGTAKTPNDFLREQLAKRADAADDSRDRKLLS